jgi:hypothetical protein
MGFERPGAKAAVPGTAPSPLKSDSSDGSSVAVLSIQKGPLRRQGHPLGYLRFSEGIGVRPR